MKSLVVCNFLLFLAVIGHADDTMLDQKKGPVEIKVVQQDAAKGESVQIQVVNLSEHSVVVDREALQQPDFTVSKDITEKDSDGTRELVQGASHGSTGGRWTVAQLHRREPKRLVTILPKEMFTLDVPITKLLSGIDPSYPHGSIEVKCTFHDFLLSVHGKDTTDNVFEARVEAERAKINWR